MTYLQPDLPPRPPTVVAVNPERLLLVLGALLIAVSPFLPWVKVLVVSVDLTGLFALGHVSPGVTYGIVASGVAVLLVAALLRSMEWVRFVAATVGAVALLFGGIAFYGLLRAVSASAGVGQMGVGPVAAVVGSTLLFITSLVGMRRAVIDRRRVQPLWRSAGMIVFAVGLFFGAVADFLPYSDGDINCGNVLTSLQRRIAPPPSPTPPPAVASVLAADSSAVATTQAGLVEAQAAASDARTKEQSAQSLSDQASTAADQAEEDSSTVQADQLDVTSAEEAASSANAAVQSDQSTVRSDSTALSQQQAALQAAQASAASTTTDAFGVTDSQPGFDVSNDQQQLQDQQQQSASDAAQLASDQTAAVAAASAVQSAKAMLAADQTAAAQAQPAASRAEQEADAAAGSFAAESAAATAVADAQTAFEGARAKQQTDESSWSATLTAERADTATKNHAVATCRTAAADHLMGSGVLLGLAVALSVFLLLRRLRLDRTFRSFAT